MDDLLTRAEHRLQVAHSIIDELQLFERWSTFGKPILVGAAAYGLVVAPDIDMEIYCNDPKIDDGFHVVKACAHHPRVWKARFSNDLNGPDMGLYWQLRYRHEDGVVWKIDMWLVREDHPGPRSARLVEPMNRVLTPEIRQAILAIKEQAQLDSTLQCGSIHIYRAVLDDGIRNADQFKVWLENHDTEGLIRWRPMENYDDNLVRFEAEGAAPLPAPAVRGYVENNGARIWYAVYGSGYPVILLHGGLGNSGNWGYQVPALVRSGYQAILIDSRGHGRSTRDEQPYSYELMALDVQAVMDEIHIEKAGLVGWSDGACTAMVLAAKAPERVAGVFYFACNMDPSGTKDFEFTPILKRCINRHKQDYRQLSTTPDNFEAFSDAVGLMQRTQPNYSEQDLAQIKVPVAIVHSEQDEFIKQEHAKYLARSIPGADFIFLPGVSHFAPLQRPERFNAPMLRFLNKIFIDKV